MIAFERALGYTGIAGFETDLRLTNDGVVVLIHDAVADYPLAELQKFSAGYPKLFGDKYLDQKIPTFKQALQLLLDTSSSFIIIMDLKVEKLGEAISRTIEEVRSHAAFRLFLL